MPDVKVLVSAFHADHPHHRVARAWLDTALQSCQRGGRLQLLPMVCTSFVRIVTLAARRHASHLVTFDKDFASLLDRHEYTLLVPAA